MQIDDFLKCVSKLEHCQLPGWSAQSKLSPLHRESMLELNIETQLKAKKASILMLCYPDFQGVMHLVLIERNTYAGVHSAQIGFPGGRPESEDTDLQSTALREMEEEIGFDRRLVQIIRSLSPIYIPPSQFYVHPFLGYTQSLGSFSKDDREVAQILEIPLKTFMQTQPTHAQVSLPNDLLQVVPVFEWQEHRIWGATAMMLSELKEMLKQVV